MRYCGTVLHGALNEWRRATGRHSPASIERMLLLAHLSGLFARGKMRSLLYRWSTTATHRKTALRLHAELSATRKSVKVLQEENYVLRQAMETLTCEALWHAAHDKESNGLRSSLAAAQRENAQLATSRDFFRDRYERLRLATNDPNYVQRVHSPSITKVGPARAISAGEGERVLRRSESFGAKPRGADLTSSQASCSTSVGELSSWIQTRHATTRLSGNELLNSFFQNLPDEVRSHVDEALRARGKAQRGGADRPAWRDVWRPLELSPLSSAASSPRKASTLTPRRSLQLE